MNAASSDFQPTSGYVQFNNATDLASFSVSTVDDTISEPEETFTARLLYVSGGATFDVDATKTMATVTGTVSLLNCFGSLFGDSSVLSSP